MNHKEHNAFDFALKNIQQLRNILTPKEIDIVNIKNIETIPINAVFVKGKKRVQMDVTLSFSSPLPSKNKDISEKHLHP
jgi:hypothetical protein